MLSVPHERGGRDSLRCLHGEDGQVLPLMIALVVLILLGGMIVFWIGFSTSQAASAQTAADAAALAAEQSAVTQLETNPTETVQQVQWSACQQADSYAESNKAHVLSCAPTSTLSSTIGYDFIVEVSSNQALPSGSPDSGHSATATARASTDPFSQASPAVKTSISYTCDASVVSGPVFTAHGGSVGFFPAAGTDYTYGCEPKLAGALDALGQARKLDLRGTSGYVAETEADVTAPAAVAHGCGDASTTPGLEAVPDSVLKKYGLDRPFPGQRDVVELSGVSCDQQSGSADAGSGGPVGLGNMNVHLVPLGGGPVGQLGFLGGAGISIGESPLQVGCQIYSVWQGVHESKGLPIGGLLVALMVAQDESDMGQNVGPNRTDPNQSVGVFQQISDDGWGSIPEEWDVSTAAAMFFEGGHILGGSSTEGLIDYYQPGVAPWALAQDVQRSGAGQDSGGQANYGAPDNVRAAQTMLGQVTSGQCKTV
jgi:hypothetical protein